MDQTGLADNTYQNFGSAKKVDSLWKPFDFLFPAGKLAKLVRVYDHLAKIPFDEIFKKVKIPNPSPVINLIGAREVLIDKKPNEKDKDQKPGEKVKDEKRIKFFAGIARAAFNCDAVIVDNAVPNGIEKYAMRRGVHLIGVAPENEIKFPKINPTQTDPMEISNGHTHLFLLNSPDSQLLWTQEGLFKVNLCQQIALKRKEVEAYKEQCKIEDDVIRSQRYQSENQKQPEDIDKELKAAEKKRKVYIERYLKCKVVHVIMGDAPNLEDEILYASKYEQPIIIVKGSEICNEMAGILLKDEKVIQQRAQKNKTQSDLLSKALSNGKFFLLDSYDSEDIAQYIHFLLTVTPWETDDEKEARARAREAGKLPLNK